MKVVCLANKLEVPEYDAPYAPKSVYYLKVGQEYAVIAILLWKNRLRYLIRDDVPMALAAPAQLFEVSDSTMPDWWRFASYVRSKDCFLQAIWGYEGLVDLRSGHYDALFDLDPEACAIFEQEAKRAGAAI